MGNNTSMNKKFWIGVPPWIIVGVVILLVPIFVFWTLENINKQKESMILLLLEKGVVLMPFLTRKRNTKYHPKEAGSSSSFAKTDVL